MMIFAIVVLCAALVLLPIRLVLARRRKPGALPEPVASAAPGAPVAARAPGADLPAPRRRRHDNSGLGHFAGHGTNEARRTSRSSR
ncbi:hypothetical protein ACQPZX_05470 [Actinoplanes sp. CA-142083]|uniref:hypothetical protein n=1 Tax=Actinoplanes sp. CA-142083 TaxID=3239903 RepID=UPI003D8E5974